MADALFSRVPCWSGMGDNDCWWGRARVWNPCRCLWRGSFLQITYTRPFRFTTYKHGEIEHSKKATGENTWQHSQRRFTEERTFILWSAQEFWWNGTLFCNGILFCVMSRRSDGEISEGSGWVLTDVKAIMGDDEQRECFGWHWKYPHSSFPYTPDVSVRDTEDGLIMESIPLLRTYFMIQPLNFELHTPITVYNKQWKRLFGHLGSFIWIGTIVRTTKQQRPRPPTLMDGFYTHRLLVRRACIRFPWAEDTSSRRHEERSFQRRLRRYLWIEFVAREKPAYCLGG